jgi:hypothetical protein
VRELADPAGKATRSRRRLGIASEHHAPECFAVEAEQGFGVGGAEVEPATVPEVDGQAVDQRRKRPVFCNALGYAVEQGYLASNPVDRIQWTTTAVA